MHLGAGPREASMLPGEFPGHWRMLRKGAGFTDYASQGFRSLSVLVVDSRERDYSLI